RPGPVQQARVEHHITIEPQNAPGVRGAQCLQQAPRGVSFVIPLVVDEPDLRRGPHDQVVPEADHHGDPGGVSEGLAEVVQLVAGDAPAGGKGGERLGWRQAEPRAESCGQDDDLDLPHANPLFVGPWWNGVSCAYGACAYGPGGRRSRVCRAARASSTASRKRSVLSPGAGSPK